MYGIRITYSKGKEFEMENISRVVYSLDGKKETTVVAEELADHLFPIDAKITWMKVYTSDSTCIVSCKDMRSISILNQTNA